VTIHELGHAFLVRRRGLRALAIQIHGLGGVCQHESGSLYDNAIIAWGGVLAQALVLLIPPAIARAVARLAGEPRRLRLGDALPALAAGLLLGWVFSRHGLAGPEADAARRLYWAAFAALAVLTLAASLRRIRLGFRFVRNAFSHRGSAAERRLGFAILLVGLPVLALVLELAAARIAGLGEGARLAFGLFRMGCIGTLAVLALEPRRLLLEGTEDAARAADESGGAAGRDGSEEAAYARSPLDRASMERIAAKLEGAMRERRLYRAPFFGLGDLSAETGVSPHRISQVLNQHLGMHFFDYVNRWRVAEARERLAADPDARIIAVAEAVGFNSKSTFNAAFRKHAGTTPSEWRRQGRPLGDRGPGAPRPR